MVIMFSGGSAFKALFVLIVLQGSHLDTVGIYKHIQTLSYLLPNCFAQSLVEKLGLSCFATRFESYHGQQEFLAKNLYLSFNCENSYE